MLLLTALVWVTRQRPTRGNLLFEFLDFNIDQNNTILTHFISPGTDGVNALDARETSRFFQFSCGSDPNHAVHMQLPPVLDSLRTKKRRVRGVNLFKLGSSTDVISSADRRICRKNGSLEALRLRLSTDLPLSGEFFSVRRAEGSLPVCRFPTFGNPTGMTPSEHQGILALWLCVFVFRRICPYTKVKFLAFRSKDAWEFHKIHQFSESRYVRPNAAKYSRNSGIERKICALS